MGKCCPEHTLFCSKAADSRAHSGSYLTIRYLKIVLSCCGMWNFGSSNEISCRK